MSGFDHVIVGSGINGLVAAAMLGKRGRRVCVVEREDRLGGCMRTEEATLPGFTHDVMATTFVLFLLSPAFAALGPDLAARGLEFSHAEHPTGVLRPDGTSLILTKDRAANVAAFEAAAPGDGAAFAAEMDALGADAPFLFSLLGGRLWSGAMLRTVAREAWRRGPRGLAAWFGEALTPARAHLETAYDSDLVRALFAPWVLHTGLGPESAYSGAMVRVIGFALEAAGAPIVTGGADRLVAAFRRLIEDQGGTVRTGADVAGLAFAQDGRACGVRLASGETIAARSGVVVSMAPDQLYGRLLKDAPVPPPADVAQGLKRFRHGKGNMQIHYALAAPPRWRGDPALARVALLHLTPGLDGVSRAANEAERGMLPAEPSVCVGQPTALDPSRAPAGQAVLWLQLPEAPRVVKGDAAGLLETPADGRWTPALREAYADRIEVLLARHIEGFGDTILARRAYSPADLEAMNVNLAGGDPYGGACGLDQSFLWRPFKSSVNHRTHVKGLWRLDASGRRARRGIGLPRRLAAHMSVGKRP